MEDGEPRLLTDGRRVARGSWLVSGMWKREEEEGKWREVGNAERRQAGKRGAPSSATEEAAALKASKTDGAAASAADNTRRRLGGKMQRTEQAI